MATRHLKGDLRDYQYMWDKISYLELGLTDGQDNFLARALNLSYTSTTIADLIEILLTDEGHQKLRNGPHIGEKRYLELINGIEEAIG